MFFPDSTASNSPFHHSAKLLGRGFYRRHLDKTGWLRPRPVPSQGRWIHLWRAVKEGQALLFHELRTEPSGISTYFDSPEWRCYRAATDQQSPLLWKIGLSDFAKPRPHAPH